jgi:SAM-dependent methyltransferase
MATTTHDDIRAAVRQRYGTIAETRAVSVPADEGSCCGSTASMSCCGDEAAATLDAKAQAYGYSAEDTGAVPEGANLGLGCGNPIALASLMLHRARANAEKSGTVNVEFRLGEIEHLPVADASVDVVISNCVINLSPEKAQVFREAFRVLKPGGRLAVSDVVSTAPFPDEVQRDLALRAGCVAGASLIDDLEGMLTDAGFAGVRIQPKDESRTFIREWVPGTNLADYLISATIDARKPDRA